MVPTEREHIITLMNWFPDQSSSYFWGGPSFRYPFTEETFIEDSKWGEIPSYSWLDSAGELLAFGQFYENLGRCHMARLVLSPAHRGKGLGHRFIKSLMVLGMEKLQVQECSLFVINTNESAKKCYQSLNFMKLESPPEQQKYTDISFMVCSQI